MKFCVVEQQGSKYFHSIDEASKILGVTRRTFFEYLKQVKVEPWDRKLVRQKSYFSEDVLGRMWVLQRRFGRTGNGRATGVSENIDLKKGGPMSNQKKLYDTLEAEHRAAFEQSMKKEKSDIRYFPWGTDWAKAVETMSPAEREYYKTHIEKSLAIKRVIADILAKV